MGAIQSTSIYDHRIVNLPFGVFLFIVPFPHSELSSMLIVTVPRGYHATNRIEEYRGRNHDSIIYLPAAWCYVGG